MPDFVAVPLKNACGDANQKTGLTRVAGSQTHGMGKTWIQYRDLVGHPSRLTRLTTRFVGQNSSPP